VKYHERARAILRSDLPAPLKITLMALSDHADESGECFPSQSRLVAETSQSERTVRRAIKALAERGCLEVVREAGRRTTYRLRLEQLADVNTPVTVTAPRSESPEPRSEWPGSTPVRVTGTPVRVTGTPVRVTGPTERAMKRASNGTGASDAQPPPRPEPPPPGEPESGPTPEASAFLGLLNRWSGPEAPNSRRWRVDRARDLDWFLRLLPEIPDGVDIIGEIRGVDDWLEGKARDHGKPGGTKAKFWTSAGWKRGLRRWLMRAEPSQGPRASPSERGTQTAALNAFAALPRLAMEHGRRWPKSAIPGQTEAERNAFAEAVRSLGGPPAICQMRDRDLQFRRRDFTAAYNRALEATG